MKSSHITTLTLLFSIFHCYFGNSQTVEDLNDRILFFKSDSNFVIDSTGFSKLPKVEMECAQISEVPGNYYHVSDLNFDGLNDLVYFGSCNPYNEVEIYLNTGNSLNRIFKRPADKLRIEKKETRTIIDMVFPSCCCLTNSEITRVVIFNNFQFSKHTLNIDRETEVVINEPSFETSISGILRKTPQINDEVVEDDCSDKKIIGNQIMEIPEKSSLIVLYKQQDWYLVLLNSSQFSSQIGWVYTKE